MVEKEGNELQDDNISRLVGILGKANEIEVSQVATLREQMEQKDMLKNAENLNYDIDKMLDKTGKQVNWFKKNAWKDQFVKCMLIILIIIIVAVILLNFYKGEDKGKNEGQPTDSVGNDNGKDTNWK